MNDLFEKITIHKKPITYEHHLLNLHAQQLASLTTDIEKWSKVILEFFSTVPSDVKPLDEIYGEMVDFLSGSQANETWGKSWLDKWIEKHMLAKTKVHFATLSKAEWLYVCIHEKEDFDLIDSRGYITLQEYEYLPDIYTCVHLIEQSFEDLDDPEDSKAVEMLKAILYIAKEANLSAIKIYHQKENR